MSLMKKVTGGIVFLFILAMIASGVFFVFKPRIVAKDEVPEHIRSIYSTISVTEFRDDEHHATCWASGAGGISCLRDETTKETK